MGTHPIFESDFDCLTELNFERIRTCRVIKSKRSWSNRSIYFFGSSKRNFESRSGCMTLSMCRLEGVIIGFDEYMNLVLDDVDEIHVKTHFKKNIGRILLKGDNIPLIQQAPAST